MRRLLLCGVAAGLSALAVPSAALAHGERPIDVFTETIRGSDVVPFNGPCSGATGTVSVDFHDTFHVTAFADGHVVITANQTGTFDFEPTDPNEPSSSGRYRTGFTSTFTPHASTNTSVFVVVGRDENGARLRFQVLSHVTFANGEVTVDFVEVRCP
jgi:hypothetical protein